MESNKPCCSRPSTALRAKRNSGQEQQANSKSTDEPSASQPMGPQEALNLFKRVKKQEDWENAVTSLIAAAAGSPQCRMLSVTVLLEMPYKTPAFLAQPFRSLRLQGLALIHLRVLKLTVEDNGLAPSHGMQFNRELAENIASTFPLVEELSLRGTGWVSSGAATLDNAVATLARATRLHTLELEGALFPPVPPDAELSSLLAVPGLDTLALHGKGTAQLKDLGTEFSVVCSGPATFSGRPHIPYVGTEHSLADIRAILSPAELHIKGGIILNMNSTVERLKVNDAYVQFPDPSSSGQSEQLQRVLMTEMEMDQASGCTSVKGAVTLRSLAAVARHLTNTEALSGRRQHLAVACLAMLCGPPEDLSTRVPKELRAFCDLHSFHLDSAIFASIDPDRVPLEVFPLLDLASQPVATLQLRLKGPSKGLPVMFTAMSKLPGERMPGKVLIELPSGATAPSLAPWPNLAEIVNFVPRVDRFALAVAGEEICPAAWKGRGK